MEVKFKTDRLQKCYQDEKARKKSWGEKVAKLYVQRVDILYAAPDAQALRALRSLDFHALKGDRQGQYSMRIDNVYRLIVTFENQPMTVVSVEEVTKHYGD